MLVFKYSLQILHKLVKKTVTTYDLTSRRHLSTFLLMSLQREDRQLRQLIKDIIFDISASSDQGASTMSQLVHELLLWFKNRENIKRAAYYQDLEKEMTGRGTGMFYKDMSQVFDMYMEVVQRKGKNAKEDEKAVESAYKELGSLITDLLDVLIAE